MKVVIFESDSDAARWDDFVRSADGATAVHRFGWRQVILESFGHACYYLAAIDDAGEVQGVLPLVHVNSMLFGNALVSVPFANYGGPICSADEARPLLLAEAARLRAATGAVRVEMRNLGNRVEGLPTLQHKVTMVLDLEKDADAQWKAFNPKLRNQIRKAEKSGLQAAVGQEEMLDGFYDVFARNMRDLGTPVHSKLFFRKFLQVFGSSARVIGVYYNGMMIAAGLVSWFRGSLEVPWASSIGEHKSLCPNNLLYWTAIRFAIDAGLRRVDFGRSTPHEGTYNFKKQWGALPVQLHWQYLLVPGETLEQPRESSRFSVASRVWQRLPVALTKVVGPPIRSRINL